MGYNRDVMNQTLKKPTIRALFVDMDGTLIGPDEQVSPVVVAAIQAAYQAGCHIIPCTGRVRFTAQPIAEQLGIPLGYAITANGATAQHLSTNEVLYCHLIPKELAQIIAQEIHKLGAQAYVYESGLEYHVERSRALYHPNLPIGPWATPPRYRPDANLLDNLPFDPVTVATFGKKAQIHSLVPFLQSTLGDAVSLLQSGSEHYWGIEIYARGIDKAYGAKWLCNHLGIAREETLAIGDHLNDLALIEWAGVGVAMHNAQPELIALADHITASVYEDGVARAIEQFILS